MKPRQIAGEFREQLKTIYGDRLKRVVLYGSCARDESTEDSDIDLAIVLDGEVSAAEEIDRMIDILTEMNLKYGTLLAIYPVSESNFVSLNSPLLANIRKEGIAV